MLVEWACGWTAQEMNVRGVITAVPVLAGVAVVWTMMLWAVCLMTDTPWFVLRKGGCLEAMPGRLRMLCGGGAYKEAIDGATVTRSCRSRSLS